MKDRNVYNQLMSKIAGRMLRGDLSAATLRSPQYRRAKARARRFVRTFFPELSFDFECQMANTETALIAQTAREIAPIIDTQSV